MRLRLPIAFAVVASLGAIILTAPAVLGQEARAPEQSCRWTPLPRLSREAMSEGASAEIAAALVHLEPLLRAPRRVDPHGSVDGMPLDWMREHAVDSSALRGALIHVLVDRVEYGSAVKQQAAVLYRRIRGEHWPLLRSARSDGLDANTLWVLYAIDRPVEGAAEQWILRVGCDASWALERFAADSERVAQFRREGFPAWPRTACGVLELASVVTTGLSRERLREMRSPCTKL